MRERQEIQEVLWRLSAADHAASRPGFDNGSVNEIRWYGTRGMIEPRAPRLSWTKPYRSMVFSVRERFDFCRPVSSARRASDSGVGFGDDPKQGTIAVGQNPSEALSGLNQTFGSPPPACIRLGQSPSVRAFICS